MPSSDFVDQELLDAVTRNIAPALTLANVYAALFTAAPNKAGGGSEVVGNAYARIQTDPNDWAVTGTPFRAENVNPILFGPATPAGWGTIVAAALFDASSGGNLLFFELLTSSRVVLAGEQFVFGISAFTVTGA
jgi:hypothetical protein